MINIEISEEKLDVLIGAALKYALANQDSNLTPLIADTCQQMATSGLLPEVTRHKMYVEIENYLCLSKIMFPLFNSDEEIEIEVRIIIEKWESVLNALSDGSVARGNYFPVDIDLLLLDNGEFSNHLPYTGHFQCLSSLSKRKKQL